MYRIVCMYTLHAAATVVSVHPLYSTVCTMLIQRFNVAQFADIVVLHLFFANSTLITTSFLKLPFLPSFPSLPLSRFLSFLVSLSIVVLSFLLMVVLFLFVIHHDEFGDCFFLLSVRH